MSPVQVTLRQRLYRDNHQNIGEFFANQRFEMTFYLSDVRLINGVAQVPFRVNLVVYRK